MKVNEIVHGFLVRSVRFLPELEAQLVEMEHVKILSLIHN